MLTLLLRLDQECGMLPHYSRITRSINVNGLRPLERMWASKMARGREPHSLLSTIRLIDGQHNAQS